MTTQRINADIIEQHIRNAHAIRSRAVLSALGRFPAALRRSARMMAGMFA